MDENFLLILAQDKQSSSGRYLEDGSNEANGVARLFDLRSKAIARTYIANDFALDRASNSVHWAQFSPGGNFLFAPAQHLATCSSCTEGNFGCLVWRIANSKLELIDLIGAEAEDGDQRRRSSTSGGAARAEEGTPGKHVVGVRWLPLASPQNRGIERMLLTIGSDRIIRVYV